MSKKTKIQIGVIVVLTMILIIMCIIYFKGAESEPSQANIELTDMMSNQFDNSASTMITSNAEIKSALTENIELHATYYLQECYVKENQVVEEGENILLYTNGEYLTAPYKCVISSINIPNIEEQCTNEHYIEISSLNILSVSVMVDEDTIDNISVGNTATIEIIAFDDKILEGSVTKISSIGSGGKFTVNIEFENDGEIMIGMSSKVSIKNSEIKNADI